MASGNDFFKPVRPVDLDAEYMNVQETAYVLHMSVSHLLRKMRDGTYPHSGGDGLRRITNKEDRAEIYEIHRQGPKPARRPRRTRKTTARRTAPAAA